MKKSLFRLLVASMMISLVVQFPAAASAQSEQADVTLWVFSGRLDPAWRLSPGQTQVLQHIINTLPPGDAFQIPNVPGYRGFGIQLGAESITVFDGRVQAGSTWLADPEHTLEIWLLGTADDALEPELVTGLWDQFTSQVQLSVISQVQMNSVPVEGFAIYLVTGGLTPAEAAQAEPETLLRQAEPVIKMDDITIYHAATHEFDLTPEGQSKLAALDVPVSGLPFVVYVDDEAIYAGAFWASYSSLSYYESVVLDALLVQAGLPARLALGYPAPSDELYEGVDLRSDPRILAAFEQAGKLD